MATSLTVTPQSAFAGGVRLDITGAPGKPVSAYASNFTAGMDSWTNSGGSLSRSTTRVPMSLMFTGTIAGATASRAITGLTVGAQYRARMFFATQSAQTRLGVTGVGVSAWVSGGTYVDPITPRAKYVALDYSFVATATSHTLTIECKAPTGSSNTPLLAANTITVDPSGSWLGTSITRTDVNGTAVPVRMEPGLDIANGASTLSLYDYEAALIGTVTYTVTDGLGGTDTKVTTLAEYRRNLATNPRAATSTSRWTVSPGVGGTAVMSFVSSGAPDGGSFARATWTNAQTTNGAVGLQYDVSGGGGDLLVAPGDYLSARVRARSSVDQRITVYVQYLSSAGANLLSQNPVQVMLTAGQWSDEIVFDSSTPAPAGTAKAHLLIYSAVTGSGYVQWPLGATLDATTLLVERNRPAGGSYFDGSTTGSGTTSYFWTGVANASASVMASPLAAPGVWVTSPATALPSSVSTTSSTYAYRTNLLTNPSAEVNTTNWSMNYGTLTRDTTQFWVGTACLKMVSATTGRPILLPSGYDPPVVAGKTYTFSAYVKTTATLSQAYRLVIEFYDSSYAYLSSVDSATFTSTASAWQRFSVTGTAPAGAVVSYTYVVAAGTSAVTTDVLYVDGIMLEQTAAAGAYFDGSIAAAGAKTYGWTGTAHASTSVETTTTVVGMTTPLGQPQNQSLVSVLDYEETSQSNGTLHTVVGRSDKVGNPGPLSLRSGSLSVFCTTYDTAKAVRELLRTGEVALLRQPSFVDMDLYFVGTSVNLRPEDANTPTKRWVARIAYEEVLAP